ncbi:hypothetical protein AGABI1DRAFT_113172 [Agaricus bisporus var. burnettii JB137-S8]|uniref:Uncharacterized protein n=1 Tax=Agaricus bisporus var. burnettii (strain JB137-S8 / ATCC MYA-4627 / FGSC 10392) TaxID=597362 RepID=K5VZI0_AGABU|nr:uncharacterized protein AGABI1DRAFT_113172 [Agaricus bisporus var. burnettii JB137-S8]EKM79929.1 hypothetical protein AGABI1DRAFT_113172 [Agaricus bisporus var. burnettii JB137-S8]
MEDSWSRDCATAHSRYRLVLGSTIASRMTAWRTDSRYSIFPIYDIESSRYAIIIKILVLVGAILFCEVGETLTFWTKTIRWIKAFIFTMGADVGRRCLG